MMGCLVPKLTVGQLLEVLGESTWMFWVGALFWFLWNLNELVVATIWLKAKLGGPFLLSL